MISCICCNIEFQLPIQRFFTPFSRAVISPVAIALRLLPTPLCRFLTRIITGQKEPLLSITVDKLLHSHVVDNTLFMANIEMNTVLELDQQLFEHHLDKFVFYFGQDDKWAPIEMY